MKRPSMKPRHISLNEPPGAGAIDPPTILSYWDGRDIPPMTLANMREPDVCRS